MNLLGRNFNDNSLIPHEIPYKIDVLDSTSPFFRYIETLFSGLVYLKIQNNIFMFFVMLWFHEVKKCIASEKGLNRSNHERLGEVALQFARKEELL
jgi:hypothetical protein